MIIIGERLNSSRGEVLEALDRRDAEYLCGQAVAQESAGASFIDLNAAAMMDGEVEALRWAIPLIQAAVGIPLALDTPNPEAMEAALSVHRGTALLNSLSGQRAALDAMLPLVKRFRPRVIALCLDDDGPPEEPGRAASLAQRMTAVLLSSGLHADDIFVDPLVRSVGVDHKSGVLFLDSLERIKLAIPGAKTVAGVSNVSFGLPRRRLLNRTFLSLAMARGLDAVICDPLDGDLQAAVAASRALLGGDPDLRKYLAFIREQARKPGA